MIKPRPALHSSFVVEKPVLCLAHSTAVEVRLDLDVREELLGHRVTRACVFNEDPDLDSKNCVLPELHEYELVALEPWKP